MNRIIATALIAASVALAGHAVADDITPSDPFVSTATRAEVHAGIAQARTIANPWSIAYNPLAAFQSSRTRDEVRAQYIASRDEVAALNGEDSGAFAMAQQHETDARVAAVQGERAVQ
jgi:L-rhamnose isomerase